MVALFMPAFAMPLARLPLHQSQAVLPGLTHELSPMALGGLRFTTMFDSTSRPACSPIINMRQPERTGGAAMTDTLEASAFGSKLGAIPVCVLMSSTRVARRAASVRSLKDETNRFG